MSHKTDPGVQVLPAGESGDIDSKLGISVGSMLGIPRIFVGSNIGFSIGSMSGNSPIPLGISIGSILGIPIGPSGISIGSILGIPRIFVGSILGIPRIFVGSILGILIRGIEGFGIRGSSGSAFGIISALRLSASLHSSLHP